MPSLITPTRVNRQPYQTARVDASTELGRLLAASVTGSQYTNLIGGRDIALAAGVSRVQSPHGVAFQHSATDGNVAFGASGGMPTVVAAGTSFSVFMRIFVPTIGVRQALFADHDAAGTNESINIEITAANQWRFVVVGAGSATGTILSAAIVTTGWHDVLAVFRFGVGTQIYVDGVSVGAVAFTINLRAGVALRLGSFGTYPTICFQGRTAVCHVFRGDVSGYLPKLIDNPWQVYKAPPRRLLGTAVSAVSPDLGTSLSDTRSQTTVSLSTGIALKSLSETQSSTSVELTTGGTPMGSVSVTPTSTTVTLVTQISLASSSVTPTYGTASLTTGSDAVTGVTVTPASVTVNGGAVVDFAWVVHGVVGVSQAVSLSTTSGTIAPDGTFVAPAATSAAQTGTVTATSVQDPTKSGTATFTIPAQAEQPTMATRTVSVTLGSRAAAGSGVAAANLTGLSVSFHDEPSPHLTTVPRYQSATETTNAAGLLTFSFSSTLPVGGQGLLVVSGAGGVHYNAPIAVT